LQPRVWLIACGLVCTQSDMCNGRREVADRIVDKFDKFLRVLRQYDPQEVRLTQMK
jgi:hypothetical protein